MRTRARLNTFSCLVFSLQFSKAGGAVEKSPVGQLGGVGGELEGPYGCPLHVRTRAHLNTYSCLVFVLQCSKAGGAVGESGSGAAEELGRSGEFGGLENEAANSYFPRFWRV